MPQIQVFLSDENKISHDLTEDKITVGRLADNSLQIDDGSVSSHHAELVLENGEYHLHDLGSTNGTFVNEEQVTDAILKHGDEVRFGRIPAVYQGEDDNGASQPLPSSTSSKVAEVAQQSARPANFISTSPIPRNVEKKDVVGIALYALTVLAFLAVGYAAYSTFALTPTL